MNLNSIEPSALVLLHQETMKAYGGREGVRDAQLLDAALTRPLSQAVTQELDVAAIAASYAAGILDHHPFFEGNDRAAFLAIGLFLYLNNWQLNAEPMEAAHTMRAAAAGKIDEAQLADWIRRHL
jgi:death-on-curing protein